MIGHITAVVGTPVVPEVVSVGTVKGVVVEVLVDVETLDDVVVRLVLDVVVVDVMNGHPGQPSQ